MYAFLYEDAENLKLFETLYTRYYHELLDIAFSILKNSACAEDAVHDTFVNIASHVDTIKGISEEKQRSYIIKMVRNKSIDYLRKLRKEILQNITDDSDCIERWCEDDILEDVCRREQEALLLQEMRKMSSKYRMVLEYYYFRDLSREEIADLMGTSVRLVDVWLHRARKRFAKVLRFERDE